MPSDNVGWRYWACSFFLIWPAFLGLHFANSSFEHVFTTDLIPMISVVSTNCHAHCSANFAENNVCFLWLYILRQGQVRLISVQFRTLFCIMIVEFTYRQVMNIIALLHVYRTALPVNCEHLVCLLPIDLLFHHWLNAGQVLPWIDPSISRSLC